MIHGPLKSLTKSKSIWNERVLKISPAVIYLVNVDHLFIVIRVALVLTSLCLPRVMKVRQEVWLTLLFKRKWIERTVSFIAAFSSSWQIKKITKIFVSCFSERSCIQLHSNLQCRLFNANQRFLSVRVNVFCSNTVSKFFWCQ